MAYHVLTISPHFAVHEGLRSWLLRVQDVHFVDTAYTAVEARSMIVEGQPDVIVIDHFFSTMSCRELVAGTGNSGHAVQAIVVTRRASVASLRSFLDCGINGFVGESATAEVLQAALDAVLDGRTYIDPMLSSGLVATEQPAPSPRELQILDFVMAGHQNKVIANLLGISQETVKTHLRTLMRKLQANGRTDLVVKALQHSLVPLPPVEA